MLAFSSSGGQAAAAAAAATQRQLLAMVRTPPASESQSGQSQQQLALATAGQMSMPPPPAPKLLDYGMASPGEGFDLMTGLDAATLFAMSAVATPMTTSVAAAAAAAAAAASAAAAAASSSSASGHQSALPVGFYTDREIREKWDTEFLRQRCHLIAALSRSLEYFTEGILWNESTSGLGLMDDAMEARIRALTDGLPPQGSYGSMWHTPTPLTQQVLVPQLLPHANLVVQQSLLIQLSIIGYSFYDGAKVRFRCSQCPKEWTSMKGRIVFHLFRLEGATPLLDPQTSEVLLPRGYSLFFRLFKQQCHETKGHRQGEHTVFEEPQWYPEEIEKVLYNVFWRIGQTLYKVSIGDKTVQMWRRAGNPSQKHDKSSCQACQQGFCQGKSAASTGN